MAKVPYFSAIGSLMYVMVCTRPDISQVVSVVSKYMSCLGKVHWQAMKWILKYLCDTSNTCLEFRSNGNIFIGFMDSDYIEGLDKRISLIGYVFCIVGCAISLKATLQHVVALCITEVEYMTIIEAIKKV